MVNNRLFTKPFQTGPCWHQLKYLVFIFKVKNHFQKWMDFNVIKVWPPTSKFEMICFLKLDLMFVSKGCFVGSIFLAKSTFCWLRKVQIFWEDHKNLAHLPLFIWQYLAASNYKWKMGQIFVAFSEYLNFSVNHCALNLRSC